MAPSQFDLWSLASMAAMVRKAGTLNPEMRARIVINRASTNPSVTETEEAREALAELDGLALSPTLVRDRIAFRRATREGLGVAEMKGKDAKAVSEITDLYREVFRDGKKR
jgi:chromosome partitioning protein